MHSYLTHLHTDSSAHTPWTTKADIKQITTGLRLRKRREDQYLGWGQNTTRYISVVELQFYTVTEHPMAQRIFSFTVE